jgi:hypothetical protein
MKRVIVTTTSMSGRSIEVQSRRLRSNEVARLEHYYRTTGHQVRVVEAE